MPYFGMKKEVNHANIRKVVKNNPEDLQNLHASLIKAFLEGFFWEPSPWCCYAKKEQAKSRR